MRDCCEHVWQVAANIVVAESKEPEVLFTKPQRSFSIVSNMPRLLVLNAVELDNQSRREAHEIGVVVSQRTLTPEFESFELLPLECRP